jgi:hypothetical protein
MGHSIMTDNIMTLSILIHIITVLSMTAFGKTLNIMPISTKHINITIKLRRSITPHNIMTLSIMITSITMLSITTLDLKTVRITKRIKEALSIMTIYIMILSMIMKNAIISKRIKCSTQHNNKKMLIISTLTINIKGSQFQVYRTKTGFKI